MAIQGGSPVGHYATLPAGSDRCATWTCLETGPPEPPKLRLLDRVHQSIGTRHDSRATEEASLHWPNATSSSAASVVAD